MKGILKQNIRKILLILFLFLVIINLLFLITSNEKTNSHHKSAAKIINAESVDKISFCANDEFFEKSLSSTPDSIDEAVKEKANAVILNIYLTKDKLFVCSPFENLKESFYLNGDISEYTYFELLEYSVAAAKKETTFSINPAIEVIRQCTENELTAVCVFHNIKDMSLLDEFLANCENNNSFVFYSNNYDLLIKISESHPSVKLWYFVDEVTDKTVDTMNLLREAEIIFNANNKNNNEEMINKLKKYSYSYGCTGVKNNSTLKKYVQLGVSDIITHKYVK